MQASKAGRISMADVVLLDVTVAQCVCPLVPAACSLYPQFAVGAEHDGMRRESEQF